MSIMAIVFLALLIFVVYIITRVYQANKVSEEDWDKVDKSKLKEWDDEDDWE